MYKTKHHHPSIILFSPLEYLHDLQGHDLQGHDLQGHPFLFIFIKEQQISLVLSPQLNIIYALLTFSRQDLQGHPFLFIFIKKQQIFLILSPPTQHYVRLVDFFLIRFTRPPILIYLY